MLTKHITLFTITATSEHHQPPAPSPGRPRAREGTGNRRAQGAEEGRRRRAERRERRAPRPDSQRPATTSVATSASGDNCVSGFNPGELPPFWTASLLTPPHERREYQKKGRTQSGAAPFKMVVPFKPGKRAAGSYFRPCPIGSCTERWENWEKNYRNGVLP